MSVHIFLIEPNAGEAAEFKENIQGRMDSRVTVAHSDVDALTMLEVGVTPDVMIFVWGGGDVRGEDLYNALRESLPDTPIIVTLQEGSSAPPTRDGIVFQGLLRKPYNYPQIPSILREVMGGMGQNVGGPDIADLFSDLTGPPEESAPQAATGPIGASGSPDVTGPIGAEGSPDVTGPIGAGGSPDVTGPIGASGSPDVTGPIGASGSPDVTGPIGADGPPDVTGPIGASGRPDATGPIGAGGAPDRTGPIGAGEQHNVTGPIALPDDLNATASSSGPEGTGPIGAGGSPDITGPIGAGGSPDVTGPIGAGGQPNVTGPVGAPPQQTSDPTPPLGTPREEEIIEEGFAIPTEFGDVEGDLQINPATLQRFDPPPGSEMEPVLRNHIDLTDQQVMSIIATIREIAPDFGELPALVSQDGQLLTHTDSLSEGAADTLAKRTGHIWRSGATRPTREWLCFDERALSVSKERRGKALYSVYVAGDVSLTLLWEGEANISELRTTGQQAAYRLSQLLILEEDF